ncbi:hypothetical protein ATEIFO6365_0005058100 [Aspergillus terreus]|uniref:Uncharacterized protein n=1 Tax=Aspergillus terreus TaxID=33178 RepID=A0A5M3Z2F9_ASPTE|nr:hypothetical protein ATETN484_0008008800 [Aspergillus terreus]GFF16391.1 hypothetical protein ATEIFO6365_0005058100 [Aspergillus terreus]
MDSSQPPVLPGQIGLYLLQTWSFLRAHYLTPVPNCLWVTSSSSIDLTAGFLWRSLLWLVHLELLSTIIHGSGIKLTPFGLVT